MRIARGLALAACLPVAGLVVAGCTTTPRMTPEGAAHAKAVEKATSVYQSLGAPDYSGRRSVTAEALGRRAAGLNDVQLLDVSGERLDVGDGVRLTVRLTASGYGYRNDDSFLNKDGETAEVTLCFDLVLANEDKDQGVHEVDCPAGEPITYPPLPTFPADLEATLKQRLDALVAPDEASVRAMLDSLRLDPSIRRDIAVVQPSPPAQSGQPRTIGLALQTVQFDCVMARITPGTPAEAWRLARVYIQPGELSCDGRGAAGGNGQHPPH
jgi:hypothetical protein